MTKRTPRPTRYRSKPERELRDWTGAIVRDLADTNPIEYHANATFWCRLCGAQTKLPVAKPPEHAEACPWRRAHEYIAALEDS